MTRTWPQATASALICALALVSQASGAAQLPGSLPIEDLVLTRDYLVEVDGEESPGAEVYYSDYEVAWLLKVPGHGSLLVSPRGKSVQRVAEKAFKKKAGAAAGLEPLTDGEAVTEFTQSRGVITFELDGHTFALRPAPPMLGRQSSEAVANRHPTFEGKAAQYRKRAAAKAAPALKAGDQDELIVRVYFGTWSPICERIVPKLMALEEAWRTVRFEYYGLPKPLIDDEVARAQRITGVPTVLVLRDGEEVARLAGRQLDSPEEALSRAFAGL